MSDQGTSKRDELNDSSQWNTDEKSRLLHAVKNMVNGDTSCKLLKSMIKWDNIKIDGKSTEECTDMYLKLTKKVNICKTASDYINEAIDLVNGQRKLTEIEVNNSAEDTPVVELEGRKASAMDTVEAHPTRSVQTQSKKIQAAKSVTKKYKKLQVNPKSKKTKRIQLPNGGSLPAPPKDLYRFFYRKKAPTLGHLKIGDKNREISQQHKKLSKEEREKLEESHIKAVVEYVQAYTTYYKSLSSEEKKSEESHKKIRDRYHKILERNKSKTKENKQTKSRSLASPAKRKSESHVAAETSQKKHKQNISFAIQITSTQPHGASDEDILPSTSTSTQQNIDDARQRHITEMVEKLLDPESGLLEMLQSLSNQKDEHRNKK